jgi:hypothetical protein
MLPIRKGLQAAYDAITVKDANTLYLVTDTPAIYLGDTLLANLAEGAGGKTLNDVSFDPVTETFTFTYSDASTKTVDLILESVLKSISYDGATHKLTLTLVSGETSELDLTDLVDAYTVASTGSINLALAAGEITATIKYSADVGNIAKAGTDGGVFVPETDLTIGTF